MGKVKTHKPVRLFIGFIFKDFDILNKADGYLRKHFGEKDFESQTLPFIHTDYYENEFGKNLLKKFISFKRLIKPEALSRIKIFTNELEKRLSFCSSRRINIDPGYLDLSKVVLATTKDYTHRLYLKKGIYAEVTLFCQDKIFKPWAWTYPDYKSAEYIAIFNQLRKIYAEQIKN